ncbi:hypothetical protein GA0070609_3181 [Micromonospora echinaurantiaca]|uniref:Extracellular repeat, HAF family n=1 Tax=Micromonospora echinaurantiaca TaxID=47857 RepID=A0A1C5IEP4_9ACTN|nr:hypothetical protein [Micromonospora echinaurantiaca]SCG56635.1 hypothetical protein GA0070609_3181 [Micromonospora echinaurantiaca]
MTNVSRRGILASVAAGLMAASLGVAATPGAATAASGQSIRLCALRPLAYPADSYRASADAIDPTGRYIAGSGLRTTGGVNQPLLLVWDGGRLTTIESSIADTVVDVNSSGVVVGNGWENSIGRPWRYHAGRVEFLPVVPSYGIWVTGINGAGDIVGYGTSATTNESFPLRWPAARPGTVEVLDAPTTGQTDGITEDGTIVGTAGSFTEPTGWLRAPAGEVRELTVPGAQSARVLGASGRYAFGWVNLGGPNTVKVRWDLTSGASAGLDPRFEWLTDVNRHGVVVGGNRISRGASSVVLTGGVSVGANAISDNGIVVGFHRGTRVSPVRWTGC